MATIHEFGIMQNPPERGVRYDTYEPEKYGCIAVHDDDIEGILEPLLQIPFYWHTLDVRGTGLAYCGITLIPPESMGAFRAVLDKNPAFAELSALLKHAEEKNKFVIHFGI